LADVNGPRGIVHRLAAVFGACGVGSMTADAVMRLSADGVPRLRFTGLTGRCCAASAQ
jgi:hypothetical protein